MEPMQPQVSDVELRKIIRIAIRSPKADGRADSLVSQLAAIGITVDRDAAVTELNIGFVKDAESPEAFYNIAMAGVRSIIV